MLRNRLYNQFRGNLPVFIGGDKFLKRFLGKVY